MLTVNKPSCCSVDNSINACSVAGCVSGTSPYNIKVVPSAAKLSSAIITACPVPFCSACSAQLRFFSFSKAVLTFSAPCPITTCIASALTALALSNTWASIDLPAIGCKTLGNRDFIREPWPAASTTTSIVIIIIGFQVTRKIGYLNC